MGVEGGGGWYGYFLELHILCRGFRIPIVGGIPDSSSCIPNSKAQDSGSRKQNFHGGFWNPDSPSWGEPSIFYNAVAY